MFLARKIRAGILPYALLMLACFSLLVQFYGNRQSSEYQQVVASRREAEAYLMAQLTLDSLARVSTVDPVSKESTLSFDKGQVQYQVEETKVFLTVQLTTGATFTYQFPLPSQKK